MSPERKEKTKICVIYLYVMFVHIEKISQIKEHLWWAISHLEENIEVCDKNLFLLFNTHLFIYLTSIFC